MIVFVYTTYLVSELYKKIIVNYNGQETRVFMLLVKLQCWRAFLQFKSYILLVCPLFSKIHKKSVNLYFTEALVEDLSVFPSIFAFFRISRRLSGMRD